MNCLPDNFAFKICTLTICTPSSSSSGLVNSLKQNSSTCSHLTPRLTRCFSARFSHNCNTYILSYILYVTKEIWRQNVWTEPELEPDLSPAVLPLQYNKYVCKNKHTYCIYIFWRCIGRSFSLIDMKLGKQLPFVKA